MVFQCIAKSHAAAMSDLPLRIKDVVAHGFAEGFERPHALTGLGNNLWHNLGFRAWGQCSRGYRELGGRVLDGSGQRVYDTVVASFF
jgi:hypothetical protein